MSLIQLKQIEKHYTLGENQITVLKNISLSISAGEMLAIVGASGSGKSTLMNIIGLLDQADSGEYFLENQSVAQQSSDNLAALRNQMIGFVFQQFYLLPRFNALQNVGLPLQYRQLSRQTIEEKACEALEEVGMGAYLHHRPDQLSGGQQQRLAIARALVGKPKMILADEPTGALDSGTSEEILTLFKSLNQCGCTLIIVTHDRHVASQCRRQIQLKDGAMTEDLRT